MPLGNWEGGCASRLISQETCLPFVRKQKLETTRNWLCRMQDSGLSGDSVHSTAFYFGKRYFLFAQLFCFRTWIS